MDTTETIKDSSSSTNNDPSQMMSSEQNVHDSSGYVSSELFFMENPGQATNLNALEAETGTVETNFQMGGAAGLFLDDGCIPQNLIDDQIVFALNPSSYDNMYQTTVISEPVFQKIFNDEVISLENWEGDFHFKVTPDTTFSSKQWKFSDEKNQIFSVKDVAIPFKIQLAFERVPDVTNSYFRASMIFTEPGEHLKPMLRCSLHSAETEPPPKSGSTSSTQSFANLNHVMLPVDQQTAVPYCGQPSGRLYWLSKLKNPEPGSKWLTLNYVFKCLNSCKGENAIRRRLTGLLFCIFDKDGNLLGRSIINIRLCSLPDRDMKEKADKKPKSKAQKRDTNESKIQSSEDTKSKKAKLMQKLDIQNPPSSDDDSPSTGSAMQEPCYYRSTDDTEKEFDFAQFVNDASWVLSLKTSKNPILQGCAKHMKSSLKSVCEIISLARTAESNMQVRQITACNEEIIDQDGEEKNEGDYE